MEERCASVWGAARRRLVFHNRVLTDLLDYPSIASDRAHLTLDGHGNYIPFMGDNAEKSFADELDRLAKRLDDLVLICNQLKEENRSLRQRQDALTAERATLLQKNEQVRARVEAMIGRLKAMEHGA